MKRIISFAILFALLLCGCGVNEKTENPTAQENVRPTQSQEITDPPATDPTETQAPATEPPATEPPATEPPATEPPATEPPATEPPATEPPATEPPVTEPPITEPEHSALYLDGVSVEDVIRYYNEVTLDAEFSTSGDATKVQKWNIPIVYTIHGQPTQEDLALLDTYTQWLNEMEGFPGIRKASNPGETNLDIHFCSQQQMINILGTNFYGCDGGVTFWYRDDAIYKETICIRTDLNQNVRNSVILEEIYNGLGPVQDTNLRKDSIIYSGYSTPQSLTAIDELILKLLYHPEIRCGMDKVQCEEVIRRLYY